MGFRYVPSSTLLLWLSVTPLACLFELFYALQHSNETQFIEGHLSVRWVSQKSLEVKKLTFQSRVLRVFVARDTLFHNGFALIAAPHLLMPNGTESSVISLRPSAPLSFSLSFLR